MTDEMMTTSPMQPPYTRTAGEEAVRQGVSQLGQRAAASATAVRASVDSRLSEAKRDAVVAVLLAIKRRGADPINGWTTTDLETAEKIGELLIALG